MADTTFVTGTVIPVDWLNDVNDAVYGGGTAIIDAANVVNTPNTGSGGSISAITVQAAIDELDTEKQPKDATLTALSGWTNGTNKIPYTSSTDIVGSLDYSIDGTFAANSDTKIPSEKASKTYADTKNIATQVAPSTSGNVLTSNGSAWVSSTPSNPVKAWAFFNGATTGTNAPTAGSSNVASITRNSTGNYTINFSPSLSNANYAFSGSVDGSTYAPVLQVVSRSVSACNFTVYADTEGNSDRTGVSFMICGA